MKPVFATSVPLNIFAPAGTFSTLGDLVNVILPNAYILAGILLFLLILLGGLKVIMGAGESDPKKTAEGTTAVTAAIVGFLIIFASYWIIKIVETITGLNILNSGK